MATTYSVGLQFSAKTRELDAAVSKLNSFDRTASKIKGKNPFEAAERGAQSAGAKVNGLVKTLGKLALAYAALRAGQAAISAGIDRIESERRIQFLAQGYGEAAQLAQAAAAAAKRFGVSQTEANEALATTYARLRPVGIGLKEIEGIYAGFSTAARISGASAQEAEGAFRQLAQGLGSGALRGDEFNSVAEQVPLILTAVSKETGIAQGALRDYAAEGKITSDVVIRALKRIESEGADQLEAALDGPQQKIKDFQNASEDLAVAFSRELVPEMTGAISELAQTLRDLIPILQKIGQVAAAVFKYIGGLARRINDMFNGAKIAQAELLADAQAQKQTREKFGALGALTKQAQEYRAAVKAAQLQAAKDALNPIPELSSAGAPDFGGGTVPTRVASTGGSSSKGGGTGDAGRQEAKLAGLTREMQLITTIGEMKEKERLAELAGDQALVTRLQGEQKLAELQKSKADAIAQAETAAEKARQSALFDLQIEEQKKANAFDLTKLESDRKERLDDLLTGFDREVELSGAKTEEAKKLLEIEHRILDLKKDGLLTTEAEIEKYRERAQAAAAAGGGGEGKIESYMNKLKTELGDTQGMIVSLASTIESEIGSAMSNAVMGLIDGTMTAQEAFSQMFKNIGKAFIEMATQMIAKALVMKILGIAFGGGGGGGWGGSGGSSWGGFAGALEMPKLYAEGGYVTGPTNAVIGEAGESEYVIPASKMGSAMSRYSAGARGESVIPPSGSGDDGNASSANHYTLETVVINNVEYATVEQVRAMGQQAASQGAQGGFSKSMRTLQNSRSQRSRLGMR